MISMVSVVSVVPLFPRGWYTGESIQDLYSEAGTQGLTRFSSLWWLQKGAACVSCLVVSAGLGRGQEPRPGLGLSAPSRGLASIRESEIRAGLHWAPHRSLMRMWMRPLPGPGMGLQTPQCSELLPRPEEKSGEGRENGRCGGCSGILQPPG